MIMKSFYAGMDGYLNHPAGVANREAATIVAPDYIDARVLAANTAERHTVPAGAKRVVFSADGDFYAKYGTDSVTAAVPAADVTDGSGSELNPAARTLDGATHISLVASATRVVTLSFYG